MTRRPALIGVACVAGLVNSCGSRPAPPVVAEPAVAGLPAFESPAPPPTHLLARFGDDRLRHPARLDSVALSTDGTVLATATPAEPVVRFWDTASGRLLRAFRVEADHTASLTVEGFAPDGRLLAVRHKPGWDHGPPMHEPVVLDPRTGAVSRWGWGDEADHYRPTLTVSPDGRTVAGVTQGGEVKVWDFGTGKQLHMLGLVASGATRSLCGACFSPDGRRVAAWCDDGSVSVAPADGSGPLARFPVRGGAGFAAWPRADRLAVGWYDGLAALDPATGRELARSELKGNMIANPRAAAGDRLFVKPDNDRDVIAIDLQTLQPVPDLVYPGSTRGEPFAVSADGSRVALAVGRTVRLFDAATGASLHPDLDRQPADPASDLHLSADGRRLLAAGGGAATWDVPAGRRLASFDRVRQPVGLRDWGAARPLLSADGRRVAGGVTPAGRPVVFDAESGAERPREPDPAGGDRPARRVFGEDPAGGLWALEGGAVWRIETPSVRAERRFDVPAGTSQALLSADGRRVAVGGWKTLAVRDADPAGEWHVLAHNPRGGPVCGHDLPSGPFPRAFSPDGRRLLADDDRLPLALWDVTGTPVCLGAAANPDWWRFGPRPAFSPDGRRFAVAGTTTDSQGKAVETSVRVWETASLAEVARLAPPNGATGVAFAPDGRRLVVAHADTTFGVWDYAAMEGEALRPGPAADRWDRLADPDPRAGLAAVYALAADPAAAVALLAGRFRPADPAAVAALAADLDAADFTTREQAQRELAALGGPAEAALRAAVGPSPSPEVARRADRVLHGYRRAGGVRAARAVEVLERVGTADARGVLAAWVAGRAGGLVAREAAAALGRLDRAAVARP